LAALATRHASVGHTEYPPIVGKLYSLPFFLPKINGFLWIRFFLTKVNLLPVIALISQSVTYLKS
ncbi:hypothetical protein, partial [Pseudoalteromonas sp. GAB2316C]|uniref:hypothetical protein n=1 Tax=Pseudoalteromonas sp. GAB2316C TaxID=3025326 RepID=UPI0023592DC5